MVGLRTMGLWGFNKTPLQDGHMLLNLNMAGSFDRYTHPPTKTRQPLQKDLPNTKLPSLPIMPSQLILPSHAHPHFAEGLRQVMRRHPGEAPARVGADAGKDQQQSLGILWSVHPIDAQQGILQADPRKEKTWIHSAVMGIHSGEPYYVLSWVVFFEMEVKMGLRICKDIDKRDLGLNSMISSTRTKPPTI